MSFIDNFKTLIGQKRTIDTSVPSSYPSQKSKSKILVVEDEQSLANVLELELTESGFLVKKAENGQVGLDMIKTFDPDLVILDLLMPVMDGKTMLLKLRDIPEYKDLPVVVLTNAGEVENIRQTKVYFGAVSFLIKSNVSTKEIVALVKDLVK